MRPQPPIFPADASDMVDLHTHPSCHPLTASRHTHERDFWKMARNGTNSA
jgi:hypothetical protein